MQQKLFTHEHVKELETLRTQLEIAVGELNEIKFSEHKTVAAIAQAALTKISEVGK